MRHKYNLYGKRQTKIVIISLVYWLAFIVNQKLKNKIYKLGKGDYRILILQLGRCRSKKPNENKTKIWWIEKDGFKPGIRPKIRLNYFTVAVH